MKRGAVGSKVGTHAAKLVTMSAESDIRVFIDSPVPANDQEELEKGTKRASKVARGSLGNESVGKVGHHCKETQSQSISLLDLR